MIDIAPRAHLGIALAFALATFARGVHAQESFDVVDLSRSPALPCAADAEAAVQQYAPAWRAVLDQPGTRDTFARSLECRLPDFRASTGIHEAVHRATRYRRGVVDFWVVDHVVSVPRLPLAPRGVIADRVARDVPSEPMHVRLYVTEQAREDLYGLLDELNAYTSELDASVRLLPLIDRIFVRRSTRDGLLTLAIFVAEYFELLTDPSQEEGSEMRAELERTAAMIRQTPELFRFIHDLHARALSGLHDSCAVAPVTQPRLGIDDRALVETLRQHTRGVCAFFPDLCRPLEAALDDGFGCEYLRLTPTREAHQATPTRARRVRAPARRRAH